MSGAPAEQEMKKGADSFVAEENPRDPAAIEEFVKNKIGDKKKILAIWTPESEAFDRQRQQLCIATAVCAPMFASFCCLPAIFGYNAIARNEAMVYAMAEDGLYTMEFNFVYPLCGCCISSGADYKFLPWSQMVTIHADSNGQGCTPFQVPQVTIMENGFETVGHGDNQRIQQKRSTLYVGNPNEVSQAIRTFKTEYEHVGMAASIGGAMQNAMQNAMVNVAPAAIAQEDEEFRVFCAAEGDAENAQLLTVNSSMSSDEILAAANELLGIEGSKVVLSTKGRLIPFKSGKDLKEDDEVVVKL
jgi:hypothetical protein